MWLNAYIGIYYLEITYKYSLLKNVDSLEGKAFYK